MPNYFADDAVKLTRFYTHDNGQAWSVLWRTCAVQDN